MHGLRQILQQLVLRKLPASHRSRERSSLLASINSACEELSRLLDNIEWSGCSQIGLKHGCRLLDAFELGEVCLDETYAPNNAWFAVDGEYYIRYGRSYEIINLRTEHVWLLENVLEVTRKTIDRLRIG